MTVLKAKSLRPARRPCPRAMPRRASVFGLAAGLLAAFGGVNAAPATAALVAMPHDGAGLPASIPAKQVPGAITVSNIDFKRGDGGAGRLILHFSGDGATPDLRNAGLVGRGRTSATRSCRLRCRSRWMSPTSPPRCSASTPAAAAVAPSWCSAPTARSNRWPTRPEATTSSKSCRVQPPRPRARRVPTTAMGATTSSATHARLQRPPGDVQLPGRPGAHGAAADRRGIQPQHRRLRHRHRQRHPAPDQRAVGPGAGHRAAGQGPGQAPQRQRGLDRAAGGNRQVRAGQGRRAHRARQPRRDWSPSTSRSTTATPRTSPSC